jgi:hypothetical protein
MADLLINNSVTLLSQFPLLRFFLTCLFFQRLLELAGFVDFEILMHFSLIFEIFIFLNLNLLFKLHDLYSYFPRNTRLKPVFLWA